ncbi:ankyrin repeat domain-containing protein [uncultured Spirosoma sp.]|uniref:ankyrin repeat domain-containing protein n=1 Tax=uncultured Spirosoma sp. TaxID=278208 RepID=UPI00258AD953|nr:ankyrin repeat domain-containing protein [uncultured Spirosoma sp.]
MVGDNPIYKHDPEEAFDGQYIQAARAIRYNDQPRLLMMIKGHGSYRPIDPNHVGKQGMTLLLWAASHENIKAVNLLLDNGADPNQKITNRKGDTFQLLAIAAKGKNDELFETLLRHNADPNSRDRDEPALFSAIYADRFDRMDALLKAGGDINITNGANTPAIVVLSRLRKFNYTLELLNKGAVMTGKAASDIAYLIQKYPLSPSVPNYQGQLKVKAILQQRGYLSDDSK